MTNRDRDSVARLLMQVVERLEAAPEKTASSAARFAAEHPDMDRSAIEAHQAGGLEAVCRGEAEAIRRHVLEYLTSRDPARLRDRGRK